MKNEQYYNNFFQKHGPSVHTAPSRHNRISKLCQGKVLDIGCGTGDLASFSDDDYTGVDFSEKAINLARKTRKESATFIHADVTDPGFSPPKNCDTVVMAEFLEHIDDDEQLLSSLIDSMNNNGRLVISVPNGDRVPDESHVRQFTVPDLREKFRPLGRVKFHNWSGFRERILLTVDLGKENKDLLGLSMIVKNEGASLERAILSAIDIVDHIAISVDSKSTDDTLKIAERYADTVKEHVWKDSFCKARNYIQQFLPTKYALCIDGHHVVKEHGTVEKYLKHDYDGYSVRENWEGGFSHLFPKIVKSDIKWKNDVHNVPDTKNLAKFDDFVIEHKRKDAQSKETIKERAEQRYKMGTKVLKEKIEKNPKDSRSYFYLGTLNQGKKNLEKALYYYRRYLRYSDFDEERWLARYNMASIYIGQGRKIRALWHAHKANEEIPNRWETAKLLGILYTIIGWWKRASDYFVQSLEKDEKTYFFSPEPRNDAITWNFLGTCFRKIGKPNEAELAYKRALKIHNKPNDQNLPDDRAKALNEFMDFTRNKKEQ